MERTLVHIIILGSIFGLTKGAGVLPDGPLNAAVGENVMFKTTLDPTTTPFTLIIWNFNSVPIVTSTPTSTIPAPGYEDRVTVNTSTGSLELRSVSVDDSGPYSVTIAPQTGGALGGGITLNVQVPVSNVSVTTSSTDLVEFSSVRLSCSSSGSSPFSFRWLNVSSEVTDGDRVQITDGGSTMTIVNVTRYDQGPYRCFVSNLVSNGTSDPVTFNISYGPYNVTITGPTKLKKGKNLKLTCIAESVPPANYAWIRNGERILNNSDVLIQEKVQTSANYTCETKNNVTGRVAYGHHYLTVDGSKLYIIAIVVGCLLVVGVSAGVAYVCIKKKKKNKAQLPPGQDKE